MPIRKQSRCSRPVQSTVDKHVAAEFSAYCEANGAPVPVATERQHTRVRDSLDSVNLGSYYTEDETEWLQLVNRYKTEHHRPFPSWCELLDLLKSLGYRKVEAAGPMPRPCKEFRGRVAREA